MPALRPADEEKLKGVPKILDPARWDDKLGYWCLQYAYIVN